MKKLKILNQTELLSLQNKDSIMFNNDYFIKNQ
jgi:hypothetical protein